MKLETLDLQIIDTHTHFYDPARPQGVPWPGQDDDFLYRRVMPEDYKSLAVNQGVKGTVVVEASRWFEDNQWILDLAEADPFLVGFVGNIDIDSDDFESNLNHLAENPLFRGIRLGGGALGDVADQSFISRLDQLASLDLELDLLIDSSLLLSVNTISEKIPNLRIMINHIGHVPIDGQPPDKAWVEGMEIISKRPNVYCKVSGFVELTKDKPSASELDYYRPTMDVLWNLFGINCLVYGSNWPVSERYASYQNVQQLAFRYFETKGSTAIEKVFWGNSKEFYKWIDRY